ncbi:MAG TPA: hypothetical protein VGL18_07335 [Actinomycetota bacterium]|jgi:hypothetical protein
MDTLRRVLYLEAGVWAVSGAALVLAPRFVLMTVFDQPAQGEFAWLRLYGVQAVGLAMLMVLVAHRIEQLWWWSWAFALVTAGTAAIVVLNAAFGLTPHQSSALWWLFAFVTLIFAFALLYGLFVSSKEQPFPD